MNALFRRVEAYRILFLQSDGKVKPLFGPPKPAAEVVLAHLARFCRANKPTVMFDNSGAVDPLASARMDGRREVWLLIQEHLHIDNKTLLQLREDPDGP